MEYGRIKRLTKKKDAGTILRSLQFEVAKRFEQMRTTVKIDWLFHVLECRSVALALLKANSFS